MKLKFALLVLVPMIALNAAAADQNAKKEISRSPAQAVNMISPLTDNFEMMSALASRDDYKAMLNAEIAKGDVGDSGRVSMKAIKFASANGLKDRFLVLRDLWQGHGGNDYKFAVLVDVTQNGQIQKVAATNLLAGF